MEIKKYTNRWEFEDRYRKLCSIQLSSVDTCIWLGIDDAEPKILASQAYEFGIKTKQTTGWVDYPIPTAVLLTTRMHLNQDQVAQLLPILQRFVETGELDG